MKQAACNFYFEQPDYIKAKQRCSEAIPLWMEIRKLIFNSTPDWLIEQNIERCEAILEMIPTVKPSIEKDDIPIRIYNNLIFVEAKLNQKANGTLLLDTGATRTVLKPEIASILNITPETDAPTYSIVLADGSIIEVPFVILEEIIIGKSIVNNLTVGIYPVIPDTSVADGILGYDFFSLFKFSIDRQNEILTLFSQKMR